MVGGWGNPKPIRDVTTTLGVCRTAVLANPGSGGLGAVSTTVEGGRILRRTRPVLFLCHARMNVESRDCMADSGWR